MHYNKVNSIFFYCRYDIAPNTKNSAREDVYYWRHTTPNFIEERDVKACVEIYVSNFTAPTIRVMMVSVFLGEDQNADI